MKNNNKFGNYVRMLILFIIVITIILLSGLLEIVNINLFSIEHIWKILNVIYYKLNIVNTQGMVKKTILAFNLIPFLIILFNTLIFFIIFCVLNWRFILYIGLVYIFVRSLLTNFYEKHFKFKGGFSITKDNLKKFIITKCQEIKTIIYFLFLMIPIRIFIRICGLSLFDFFDNILSTVLLILLSLPFIYYFSNLLKKYLKKIKIELEDYLLFNNYVINNVNLYNIIYIVSAVLLINYCSFYYFIFMFILLLLLIYIIFKCFSLSSYNLVSSKDKIHLEANPDPYMIAAATALGVLLGDGANEGSSNYSQYINSWSGSQIAEYNSIVVVGKLDSNNLVHSKEGMFSTTNFIHKEIKANLNYVDVRSIQTARWIERSPILRIVYEQQLMVENKVMQERYFKTELKYKPCTLFVNEKFLGSVGRISNTLIVNLVRLENLHSPIKKTFLPTHYMANPNIKHLEANIEYEPIWSTIKIFEEKFGIYIPDKWEISHIITLTELEFMGHPNLTKLFRPSIHYTDLDLKFASKAKYYQNKRIDKTVTGNPLDKALKLQKGLEKNLKSASSFDKRIYEDVKLNRLYITALQDRYMNFIDNSLKVEPSFPLISTEGHLYYKCVGKEGITSLVLFREDDSPIYGYKDDTYIDMIITRQKLIEKLRSENLTDYKYYVICANEITTELLLTEKYEDCCDDTYQFYSIMDITNLKHSKRNDYTRVRQIFNILHQEDWGTVRKLLELK